MSDQISTLDGTQTEAPVTPAPSTRARKSTPTVKLLQAAALAAVLGASWLDRGRNHELPFLRVWNRDFQLLDGPRRRTAVHVRRSELSGGSEVPRTVMAARISSGTSMSRLLLLRTPTVTSNRVSTISFPGSSPCLSAHIRRSHSSSFRSARTLYRGLRRRRRHVEE